jgi:multidrug efflux pump subunit AcrA (membrane-fusion protein)
MIWVAAGVAAVLLTTLGISRLKPAAPDVERSTLLIETVKRGTMIVSAHGSGTLEPESQQLVSAVTAGRVDRVLARPGTRVAATTVLVELSNPDVELQALDAERQLKLAEAELASLRSTLEGARASQQATLAASQTELREAERGVTVSTKLAADGLASSMEIERAQDRATEARTRHDAEQRRMELADEALTAQLDLRRSEVERLRAIERFQRERVASMKVLAGADGDVQELSLQPGQWVQSGQLLARVSASERLKAVIRIPEGQARDLALGLPVSVDTRDALVRGRVARIDPSVTDGTVTVDIAFDGPLPRGTRPDLSVDATIEIAKLPNVLMAGRPVFVSPDAITPLFKLDRDGHAATRVPVRIGRASFNSIEIVGGLAAGDAVILSDMSQWDHVARVRLR